MVFSTALVVVTTCLHWEVILVFLDLDNWLLKDRSSEASTKMALFFFPGTGSSAQHKKIHFNPVQRIQFIGVYLHSLTDRAYLPTDRLLTLSDLVRTIQGSLRITVRNTLQLLDHMSVYTFVNNQGILSLWFFQNGLRMICSLTKDSLDKQLTVPFHVKNSLDWWKDQLIVSTFLLFFQLQR